MSYRLYLIDGCLDHLFWPRAQQVLGAFSSQEAVRREEPISHTPALFVPRKNCDDRGQFLVRSKAVFGIKSVAGVVVNALVVNGKNLTQLLPLVGLGAGVDRAQAR